VAPTFDEDNSPGRLRSLWSAGRDLTAAAADRAELEAALAAAQREYAAALAARSALLGAFAGMQAAYAAAHIKAVQAGWSSTELSEAGLPAPAARHGGVREPVRQAATPPADPAPVPVPVPVPAPAAPTATAPAVVIAPAVVAPPSAVPQQSPPQSPTRRRRAIREQSAASEPTPRREPQRSPATPPPGPRSPWDAEQTANLVTSRSTDNPVWYESMRYSRISPPTAAFNPADLDSAPWTGLPSPSDGREADGTDQG
jgi:hypothetical protein